MVQASLRHSKRSLSSIQINTDTRANQACKYIIDKRHRSLPLSLFSFFFSFLLSMRDARFRRYSLLEFNKIFATVRELYLLSMYSLQSARISRRVVREFFEAARTPREYNVHKGGNLSFSPLLSLPPVSLFLSLSKYLR